MNEYIRNAIARAIAGALPRAEQVAATPLVVVVMDPTEPLVRQLAPQASNAYAATPASAQASTILVAAAGAWSVFSVVSGGLVCASGGDAWTGMPAPEPQNDEAPTSSGPCSISRVFDAVPASQRGVG